MRTNVAGTSLDAFYSLSPAHDLEPQERVIMELFEAPMKLGRRPVELSRQQIARILQRPINSICGRANSLVAKGALVERGERKGESGRAQKLLILPVFDQAGLFQ